MDISPRVEKQLSNSRGKKYPGDGYSFVAYFPNAIRYEEEGRFLTVWTERCVKHRNWTFNLPDFLRILLMKSWLEVSVEKPLFWDNSKERPTTPEGVILNRIEAFLRKRGWDYRLKRLEEPSNFSKLDREGSEL